MPSLQWRLQQHTAGMPAADNTAACTTCGKRGGRGVRGGYKLAHMPLRACCLQPLGRGIAADTDCRAPPTSGVSGTAAQPTCRGGGCPLKGPIGVAGAVSLKSRPAPHPLLLAPLAGGRHLCRGLTPGLGRAGTCSRLHFRASVLTLHKSGHACIEHYAQAATVCCIGRGAISGGALWLCCPPGSLPGLEASLLGEA